jgi:hypothetical protein
MPTDYEIIARFEQLYKQFGSDLSFKHNMQHAYKIYVDLKKVRRKLTEAENNFLALHNSQPQTQTFSIMKGCC